MKTDIYVKGMFKRLENMILGSSPSSSKWDLSSGYSSNWDMINNTIKENPDNTWFIPRENVVNAWTCAITLTVGNIDLRDFELERKFADMRHARVEEYDQKWEEACDRGDKGYLSKYNCPGLNSTFWSNWTQEEKDYYSNTERFPILKDMKLKDPNYKNMWDLEHSDERWYNDDGTTKEDPTME
jgi:hypothetical protein